MEAAAQAAEEAVVSAEKNWSKPEIKQLFAIVRSDGGPGNWNGKAAKLNNGRSGQACSAWWYRIGREMFDAEASTGPAAARKRTQTAVSGSGDRRSSRNYRAAPAALLGTGRPKGCDVSAAPTAESKRPAAQQPEQVSRKAARKKAQTSVVNIDVDALQAGSASAVGDSRREDVTGHVTQTVSYCCQHPAQSNVVVLLLLSHNGQVQLVTGSLRDVADHCVAAARGVSRAHARV